MKAYYRKLGLFVDVLYSKVSTNNDRITICSVGVAQYLNYLIDKGFIVFSEKREYSNAALDLIEQKFGSAIPSFVKEGMVELMQEVKTYDYEVVGQIINKVNKSF